VFSQGWPLNADAWDDQAFFVAANGYRAIAHDRRGHGRCSQPGDGNDTDHYADDLAPPSKSTPGAPHGLANTTAFKDTLNSDLLAFLRG